MKKLIEKISPYIIYFMLYSMIGWIYEVFLEVVVYRWGFSNRGVLFGPWLPVYGTGALIFIFLVYPIIKEKSLQCISRGFLYLEKITNDTNHIYTMYVKCDTFRTINIIYM